MQHTKLKSQFGLLDLLVCAKSQSIPIDSFYLNNEFLLTHCDDNNKT